MVAGPKRGCRGFRRALVTAAVALVSLIGARAEAKDDEQGRPWARGTWGVSPNLGVGFSRDLIPLTLGAGGSYFVANGLGLGLSVNDTIFIYTSSFKSRFPDVNNQIPTNSVFVTPSVRYIFYRSHRFSPYVFGALGPVFFNHGGGTRGYWAAGPAVLIGVGGPIYLNLGVTFSGIFPNDKCLESFEYVPPDSPDTTVQFDLGCGFGWGPAIGITFAPRGRGKPSRRERERERQRRRSDDEYDEPPPNPFSEDESEPEPPSAGAATQTPGVVPSGSPADAVVEPPPTDPATGPAAPPSDTPPAAGEPAPPAGEPAPPADEPAPPAEAPPAEAPPAEAPPPTDAPSPDGAPSDPPVG